VAEAYAFVIEWFAAAPKGGKLRFIDVQRAIGINGTSNFRTAIRQHPDLVASLTEHDIREDGRGYIKLDYGFQDEAGYDAG